MPFDFFGSMPAPMQRSKLYWVELDSISGRIAKQLYQNANISITGFENTTYPDNFFDVVVGNVPFGDYKVFDPKYNKYNFRIHDYFLAKALDQVRPGGMVAVITTKGTLDKANPTIRKYMAERAELVGAIRLPNTAFKDNAGTEVTADILFLQKRERKIDIEPDWVHLGVTENGIAVNSYFAEHPEMMLGSMEYDTRIYGQDSRYTVCVNNDENFNMYEALNKAIGNIKAQMTDFERVADEAEQMEEVIPADPDVRNYTYTFYEGKLYYRENSEMVRKEVSQTAEERIRSLDEIRQITRELIDIQMDGCSEEEFSDNQRLLNVKYDAFIKQYGAITSKANRIAFRDDSDSPLLCSLEEVNEDGEVKKADMFYKQTIKAKTVIDRVETAVEALNVSVNELLKKNAIALSLELFVNGSLNIFNHQTNVDVDNRFTVYGIRDLGTELSPITMLVMMESIQNRIVENGKRGKATWLYIDEFHVLLNSEYSAKYLQQLWKKVRKQGGLCTGITQNVVDLLQNYTATTMLANSEFVALLKQANTDSSKMAEVIGVSEAQLRFVTNTASGMGLIKCGSVVIPFDNQISKDTDLYRLYNTNIHEIIEMKKHANEKC